MSPSYNGFGIRDNSVNPRQKLARRLQVSKDNLIMSQIRPSTAFP